MLPSMEEQLEPIIRSINERGIGFVCAYTGGGSLFQSMYMTIPGASKAALDWRMPYKQEATDEFLGGRPEKYCSDVAARQFAMQAFIQSRRLGGEIGLGATCSLVTEQPKRGPHHFHVAAQTSTMTLCRSFVLSKEPKRNRYLEELFVAKEMLLVLAKAVGITVDKSKLCGLRLTQDEQERGFITQVMDAPTHWQKLMSGERQMVGGYDMAVKPNEKMLVFPGSFNPLHPGHRGMFAAAKKQFPNHAACYEISIINADHKRPLDFIDMNERLTNFDLEEDENVVFTRLPYFLDKAKAFGSKAIFVVGLDTMKRIADAAFSRHRVRLEDDGLREWQDNEYFTLGNLFLVFGRRNAEGKFIGVHDVPDREISQTMKSLCIPVSEDEFRLDVSSTDLRTAVERQPFTSVTKVAILRTVVAMSQESGALYFDTEAIAERLRKDYNLACPFDMQFWNSLAELSSMGYLRLDGGLRGSKRGRVALARHSDPNQLLSPETYI